MDIAHARFLLPIAALLGCGVEEPAEPSVPNIIIVSIDTLRADRVGATGGLDGLTPNLDRLAADSVVFTKAYAPSTETLFSHASLFSGRFASELSTVDYHFGYPENVPTMAEVLGMYGYRTGAAVAGGHLSPVFGLGQGFEHYKGPEEWGSLWHTVPAALEWLDSSDERPFFLFVHGYDTHSRYLKPAPVGLLHASLPPPGPSDKLIRSIHGTEKIVDQTWHRRRRFKDITPLDSLRPHSASARSKIKPDDAAFALSTEDVVRVQGVYDGAVAYADLQIGLLMGELEARGALETSWIIVLSDHGEELGENGYFNHRLGMSEELLRVPLIIRPPGGSDQPGRVDTLTSLIDLMPTVLQLAQAPVPAGLHGRSLVAELTGGTAPGPKAVFAEGPWRIVAAVGAEGGLSFSGLSAHSSVLQSAIASTPLSSPAYETWGEPPEEGAGLRAALSTWRATVQPHTPRPSAHNEERRKILQQRGYWSDL
jgi:arylsulfatase A-like enzyme